ncbi:MAG: YeeE/YedE thiosulfate transporter family protein [Saprospiraceae bacterium]
MGNLLLLSETWLSVLSQPWHWAVSGLALSLIVFLLTWMGRKFGMSSSFDALCTVAGAGKRIPYFDTNLKDKSWLIFLVIGTVCGGFIATQFLASPSPVAISAATIAFLDEVGLSYPASDDTGRGFIPTALFNWSNLAGISLSLLGGFFVGFGARYGRGCTSGHAITGLAHFHLPSLLTVIGFFMGGLITTHLVLPWLLKML